MFLRFYDAVVGTAVVTAFSVMLVAALLGTVTRYITFLPVITWGEELTRFAGIWSVFLVSGISVRHGAHLGIDMVTRLLPRPLQLAVSLAIYVLMLAFALLLLVYGIEFAGENMNQLSAALLWRMGLVDLCIPLGGALMGIEIVAVIWRHLHGREAFKPRIGGPIE